jgi:hypothetical protein
VFDNIVNELGEKGTVAVLGLLCGSILTWLLGWRQRRKQQQRILCGDARDTVIIQQHVVATEQPVPTADSASLASQTISLRIRSLGQSEVSRVVPNGYLADVLLQRAFEVTPRHTLISMEGAHGSYLLETLTNFVCDRVGNGPFEHDTYVMAPCCEPAGLAEHQPITILLISVKDLGLFESWSACRSIKVERGNDGARVLTLMEMARRHREEQSRIAELRKSGQRTRYVETMYVLDLALDRRTAPVPLRDVPWGRFEGVLKELNLE